MTLTIPKEPQHPQVWYDVNAESFFASYRMEGVDVENEDENSIYIEVQSSMLLPAITCIKKSLAFLEIKLSKTTFPFFTITMKVQSTLDQEKKVLITNQVPVIVIPRMGWDDFDPFYGPYEFDVKVKAPRFAMFKRFIDTFKFVKTIKLVVRRDQTFTIEAGHEATRLFTIFQNPVNAEDYKTEEVFDGNPVSVLVDQKKISNWLHSLSFETPFKLYCFMQHETQLKLFIRMRDDLLCNFVIPAEVEEFNASCDDIFSDDE